MAEPIVAVEFKSYTKLDPKALADLLRSPDGAAARELMRLGDKVVERARALVGVSKPPPVSIPYRHPRKEPHGWLRDHIVKRLMLQGDTLLVRVGADVPYAKFHHEGWPGGVIIRPRRAKVLAFWWPKAGAVVYAKQVRQGSFEGNPFLVKALDVLK